MEKSIEKNLSNGASKVSSNGANYASYQTRLNRNYRSQLLDVLLQGIALFGPDTVHQVVDDAFGSYHDFLNNSVENAEIH